MIPKIISVDDHVVEPPHVWQRWLPSRFRSRAPRVERAEWGPIEKSPGARYQHARVEGGTPGDCWIHEDRVIYVHKRFVAIPLDATPDGDVNRFDRTVMQMVPMTYDEMRPGCYDPRQRAEDLGSCHVDGSLAFPTFPRFCGQTFMEGDDKDLGLACIQAYNDWMIEEWCGESEGFNIPLGILPLWDVERCVDEIRRNADRGMHAVCFSELPTHLGLPSIHTGYWDPMFATCQDTDTTVCMHIGSSSQMPAASPDAPQGVGAALSLTNSIASLMDFLFSGVMVRFDRLKLAYSEGQIGWIPYALERADTTWEQHNAWTSAKDLVPEPPSSYYRGRVFGCFTSDHHGVRSIDEVGEDNICFETDYPHTDTSWPHTLAVAEKMVSGLTAEQQYKVLRGNAIRMLALDRV